MNTLKVRSRLSQNKDKSNIKLILYLSSEDMDTFLLDKGEQPKGMIKVIVKRDKTKRALTKEQLRQMLFG